MFSVDVDTEHWLNPPSPAFNFHGDTELGGGTGRTHGISLVWRAGGGLQRQHTGTRLMAMLFFAAERKRSPRSSCGSWRWNTWSNLNCGGRGLLVRIGILLSNTKTCDLALS